MRCRPFPSRRSARDRGPCGRLLPSAARPTQRRRHRGRRAARRPRQVRAASLRRQISRGVGTVCRCLIPRSLPRSAPHVWRARGVRCRHRRQHDDEAGTGHARNAPLLEFRLVVLADAASPGTASLFSAHSRPPCAFTISCEIERPRPEFLPFVLIGLRPVGVEALEHVFEAVGRDARTVVVDGDDDRRAVAGERTRTGPSGGENDSALSIRLVITWPSRPSWPSTQVGVRIGRCRSRPSPCDHCSWMSVEHLDDAAGQRCEIEWLGLLQRQFGIEARGLRHVADQAIEAHHFAADLQHQFVALLRRSWRRRAIPLSSARPPPGSSARAPHPARSGRSPRCACRARRSSP